MKREALRQKLVSAGAALALGLGALMASAHLTDSYTAAVSTSLSDAQCPAALAEEEEPRGAVALQRCAAEVLRVVARILVLGPLALLLKLAGWALGKLLQGLLPWLRLFLGEWLFGFVTLLVILSLLYLALQPGERLRSYLTVRHVTHSLLVSAALAAGKCGVLLFCAQSSVWHLVPRTAAIFLSVVWLWHKTLQPPGAFGPRLLQFCARIWGVSVLLALCGGLVGFRALALLAQPASLPAALLAGAGFYAAGSTAALGLYLWARRRRAAPASSCACADRPDECGAKKEPVLTPAQRRTAAAAAQAACEIRTEGEPRRLSPPLQP